MQQAENSSEGRIVRAADRQTYFIWTKTGRKFSFAHQSKEAAYAEAERLARKYPGQKFHVLLSIEKVFFETALSAAAVAAIVADPDVAIARQRLAEIDRDPENLVSGEALQRRLDGMDAP